MKSYQPRREELCRRLSRFLQGDFSWFGRLRRTGILTKGVIHSRSRLVISRRAPGPLNLCTWVERFLGLTFHVRRRAEEKPNTPKPSIALFCPGEPFRPPAYNASINSSSRFRSAPHVRTVILWRSSFICSFVDLVEPCPNIFGIACASTARKSSRPGLK